MKVHDIRNDAIILILLTGRWYKESDRLEAAWSGVAVKYRSQFSQPAIPNAQGQGLGTHQLHWKTACTTQADAVCIVFKVLGTFLSV